QPRSREEAGRDQMLVSVWRQFIAGDLLLDEIGERQIAMEGIDHPIAITPGERAWVVALIALGFRPAGDVEPVAGPAFAIARRGEQAIDGAMDYRGLSARH